MRGFTGYKTKCMCYCLYHCKSSVFGNIGMNECAA